MAGLAPRQKAKKGRFGVGGTAPDLTVGAFPAQFTSGVGQSVTASASDDVDGDLSSYIVWTSNLDGVVTPSGSPEVMTLTTVGTHIITVSVTALTGSPFATTSVTLNTTVVA